MGGPLPSRSRARAPTDIQAGAPYVDQSLTVQPGSAATFNSGGTVTNAGTVELGAGSRLAISGTLTNTGTILDDAGSGSTTISGGYLASSGAVEVNGSLTYESYTLTNSGLVTVASGASFTDEGTFANDTGGSIANSGTFDVGADNTFTEAGGTTSGNPVTLDDSYLNFTGGGTASFSVTGTSATDIQAGAPYVDQSLTVQPGSAATFNSGGTVTNAGTVELGAGSRLAISGTLTNTGTILDDAGSGSTTISGGYLASSGAVEVNGSLTYESYTLTNSGLVTVASGASFTDEGTFANDTGGSIANSGTFDVGADNTFTEAGGTTSGNPVTLDDSYLNFTGGGTASFSVTGTSATDIQAGAPYVDQSLTVQPGSAATFNSGGTVTNAGTVELGAGSRLAISGTLTNTGTIDSQVSAQSGVTISGGPLDNNGNLILGQGSATSETYAYSQGSAGTLTVNVASATSYGQLVVGGTASLAGGLAVNTSGFSPTVGETFAIITSGGARSGQFATHTFGAQPYTTQYLTNGVDIVAAQALAVTTTSLPAGTVETPYAGATLASSGGTLPITWQVTSGSLPTGLSLDPTTGAITGTPTGPAGTSNFTVTATDSGSPAQTASGNLSLSVTGPITQTSPTSDATTTASSAGYTSQITTSGQAAGTSVSFTTTVSSSALSVSGTGIIATTGTLSAGSYTVSGTDSDGVGDLGGWTFTLSVTGPITQTSPTSGTTTTASSADYTGQITTSGQAPSTTVGFTTTVSSSALSVSGTGAIATTGTLSAGSYTVSGTDSDGVGDLGGWTFTLSVTGNGTVSAALSVSSPTVVGVETVPESAIPASSVDGSAGSGSSGAASAPLSSIPLSSIALSSSPLHSIPLSSIPLSSIAIPGSGDTAMHSSRTGSIQHLVVRYLDHLPGRLRGNGCACLHQLGGCPRRHAVRRTSHSNR